MKKHILLYVLLVNLTFAGGTKANPRLIASCLANKNIVSAKASPSVNYKTPFKYILTQNEASNISLSDSLRRMNHGDILFSDDKISISSVFPNPASAYASIDYNLTNQTHSAKIILCNVLGNVVREYTLVRDARRLNISTLELTSGVYFYSLYIDGKNLVTRKLIIKHNS